MAKRNYLRLACSLVAILLLFQVLNSCLRSLPIAQATFRTDCAERHDDYSSYTMIGGNVDLLGHYWDFKFTKGVKPDIQMGYERIYVTWIGTTSIRGLKDRPF